METRDILRFNVYTQIYSNVRQYFYLESWDGKIWDFVDSQEGFVNYDSLDKVAKRIVQLSSENNSNKRIIFSERALDNKDGKLEGILLENPLVDGDPTLIDSLTRDEKVELLECIGRYKTLN